MLNNFILYHDRITVNTLKHDYNVKACTLSIFSNRNETFHSSHLISHPAFKSTRFFGDILEHSVSVRQKLRPRKYHGYH